MFLERERSMRQSNSVSQVAKAEAFRRLHAGKEAFVVPNPWDLGTARLLEKLGFNALATTSLGLACSHGLQDNLVPQNIVLQHLAEIAKGTQLPVTADLGNGFGDSPETVSRTIVLAAAAGVVGGSIEDSTGRDEEPIYPVDFAAERIHAAAVTARDLSFPFTLTARAENYMVGRINLADTIRRLQAYQEAGADVLYAPGLRSSEEIGEVVRSLNRPVNVLIGLEGATLSVKDLDALGVRRISVGGSLAKAAMGEFLRAATELRDHGTTTYQMRAVTSEQIKDFFGKEDP
ncbi:isocitrate lyase/PEP mutase family protein [Granulicella paludicola]|uniref:isocitrate lyase/PEP mutase family protein n=1 Tax=Granulicella paludicola TaxID=474951 RepID=UPI0021DFE5DA|nr:isocitrate lyase/phosphoenolpyruvate mutase family protein [Granulicella paludicola]